MKFIDFQAENVYKLKQPIQFNHRNLFCITLFPTIKQNKRPEHLSYYVGSS